MTEQQTLDALMFPDPPPVRRPLVERHHYIGRCPVKRCRANPIAAPAPIAGHECPTHRGTRVRWEQVVGSHADGIKCDARCQYAKGPSCDCSCAGANHGAGWMA